MALYFFLSYAGLDGSPLVKRFFEDLSDTIRIRLGHHGSDPVGFYDDAKYHPDAEWKPESAEALRTSHVMLPLLSPAYFRDKRTGKEWRIFEMRKNASIQRLGHPEISAEILKPVITPLFWKPWNGPKPHAIAKAGGGLPHTNGELPMVTMLKSMAKLGATYADFMHALADHVIEITSSICLPPLDCVPKFSEISDAFLPTERYQSAVRGERAPVAQKLFAIDADLIRTLADQIDETEKRISNSSLVAAPVNGHTDAGAPRIHEGRIRERSRREMPKYTVWVIDDTPFMLQLIEEICLLTGQFEITTYEDPKMLMSHVSLRSFNNQEMPDLFVIDLKLEEKEMQGLELISNLASRRDVRSAIMAISGYTGIDELPEAVDAGADWAAIKPFSDDFVEQLLRVAEIGRNRRFNAGVAAEPASGRDERPVFLSYCATDLKAGNRVRRNLEARGIDVWYAPDALEPGAVWRDRIRRGLSEARVLVALISPDYIQSAVCKAELSSFLRRMKSEVERPPLLVPVLFECPPEVARQDEMIKPCLRYQYVTMSNANSVDALTYIYWTIKFFLERDADEAKRSPFKRKMASDEAPLN